MDPDRVLMVMRAALLAYDRACENWSAANEEEDDAPCPKDAERYSEALEDVAHVLANGARDLDEWLSKGGHLPAVWEAARDV